jgi:hypothetical protein
MTRSLHRILLTAAIALLPLSALAGRYVVINGQRLSEVQIKILERYLGGYVRNGAYWFNPYTGAWGYVGNLIPMGYISGNRGYAGRRQSLSERGRLYYPGEILSH